jgi:hypothetical protein
LEHSGSLKRRRNRGIIKRPEQTGGSSSVPDSSTLAQTMVHETTTEVYQLHVWILQISPRFVPVSYSPSDASVDVTDARCAKVKGIV